MNFVADLKSRWQSANSLLCVGLDPDPSRVPAPLAEHPDRVFEFCRAVVDATADLVCAFKPQVAHFSAQGAEDALRRIIAHIHDRHPGIPVILDAKRGDIGSTAALYAVEAYDRYGADAVTASPYLGRDSLQPFLDRADKGVVVLCRTSNAGSAEFQNLDAGGRPLYQWIADAVAHRWNINGNCALVVGATWPTELAEVRLRVGDMPLLVPGIGAQGGDIEAVVRNGRDSRGAGLIVSASRAVLYASDGADFAAAARTEATRLRDEINRWR